MAKDFAVKFYNSKAWRNTRRAVWQRDKGMCTIPGCYRPASDVHHIIELTPENIDDPNIALNPENLRSLCWRCHRDIHRAQDRERKERADSFGRVIIFDADGYPVEVTTEDPDDFGTGKAPR